jgi:hypothetical protein
MPVPTGGQFLQLAVLNYIYNTIVISLPLEKFSIRSGGSAPNKGKTRTGADAMTAQSLRCCKRPDAPCLSL